MDAQSWTVIITAITTALMTILAGAGGWYLKLFKLKADSRKQEGQEVVKTLTELLSDMRNNQNSLFEAHQSQINEIRHKSEEQEKKCRIELEDLRKNYVVLERDNARLSAELDVLKKYYEEHIKFTFTRQQKNSNETPT